MKLRCLFRKCLPAIGIASFCLTNLAAQDQPAAPAAQEKAAPAAAPASTPAAAMTVKLPVTPVDDKGDPVKGLTPADLVLTDNGQTRSIQSFSPDPSSNLVIGLIGETTPGLRAELGDERLATVHFVDHTLPGSDDKAFLIQYANEVDLLANPTATTNTLHDAINQLGSPQFGSQSSSGDNSSQSSGTPHLGGSSGGTLYDAIYLASMEVEKKEPGRHILVVITDGIDRDSKESISGAIEAAQNAHTAVFAIYYKGEEEQQNNSNPMGRRGGMGYPGGGGGYPGGYPGGGGGYPGGRRGGQTPSEQPHVDGRKILEHICNETGGYMIEGKRDKADEAYAKLGALLKNQYSISFALDPSSTDSAYHRFTLTAKRKNVWPLMQEGYTTQ